jgi:hypothetical protein
VGGVVRVLVAAGLLEMVGCAFPQVALKRAEIAATAQKTMPGTPKDEVLACMGIPAAKDAQGDTEVWSYNSGDGRTVGISTGTSFASGQAYGSGNAVLSGNTAFYNGVSTASASASTFGLHTAAHFYCVVNVVFRGDIVSKVNYSGPTGPPLAPGEQCAYAVQNCLR